MRSRAVAPSLALVLALVAISCDTPDPMTARDDDVIQVASFDFAESELIADLYVEALRSAGFEVRHLRRAGTREVVLPALELGLIDVVPEYAGSAVGFLGGEPSTDPSPVEVLTPEELERLAAYRDAVAEGLFVD